jgi:uncharacterized membrane protein YGL010W
MKMEILEISLAMVSGVFAISYLINEVPHGFFLVPLVLLFVWTWFRLKCLEHKV